jgi:serine/threonine protein kinase
VECIDGHPRKVEQSLCTVEPGIFARFAATAQLRFLSKVSHSRRGWYVYIPRFPAFPAERPYNILTLAIDLLEKMLVFDPQTRIDCIGSLEHKYMAEYHDLAYEPIAESFDWAFSDAILPVATWKGTIRSEIAGASLAPLPCSTF